MWHEASDALCAHYADTNAASRTVAWQDWQRTLATLVGARAWQVRGGGWCSNSRTKDTLSEKSRAGSGSARMRFANFSDGWDGKPPHPFKPSSQFPTQELRTQNCPLLCLLPLRHHRQARRRVRTQTCPLFPRLLKNVLRPLKEHSPADLGRVLGLDRAPEVKTLRRKLARLAAHGRAAELGRALAQRRVAQRGAAIGFLYIDGHVRVYHGQRRLPKAHVAQMRLSMPATSDYWVNDTEGDPLFVVTAEANASLVKMLPGLLQQVRSLVGKRRITAVFDRGGYSPKLFQQILAAGFDLLTYRKGRYPRIPQKCFHECRTRREGRTITYTLADQPVRLLKGKLRLRQVTRQMENGHQTPILTSRPDLPAAQVAFRMFERWRQENFFKYLSEEYALDALAEYAVVPDDPTREVPNPAWAAVDAEFRQAQAQLDRLQAEYGLEAFTNLEAKRSTMRGFKIAQGKLAQKIWTAGQRLLRLEKRRTSVPRRVPVQKTSEEPIVKLAPERKHLTNLVKMVAYQAESALLKMVASHYRRVDDEGRTLIQSALASVADIKVTDRELRVTLAPLSSAHRTRAIAALCEELNRTETIFPGSRLRLNYAIRES